MKRLYRSKHDRVIAGVCGGIAGYFNIDPVIIRIIWAIAIIFGGTGVIAYIICWFVMPEEPVELSIDNQNTATIDKIVENPQKPAGATIPLIIGGILLVIGIALLFSNFGFFPFQLFWRVFPPALIILIGIAILITTTRKK